MKLKQSKGELVNLPQYGKSLKPLDYHHGFHRQNKGKNLNEKYFYIVIPEFGWRMFDYLSLEDQKLYLSGKSDTVDWKKYQDDHNKMNKKFSDNWKLFYETNKIIIDKYKFQTMSIMLGSHFTEGRSNAFFIIENDSELELFLNDMKSIGLDTEDL